MLATCCYIFCYIISINVIILFDVISAEFFEASALMIAAFLYYQVLGTDGLNTYLNKYRIELDPQLEALVGRYSIPWLTKPLMQSNYLCEVHLHIFLGCRHSRKPWSKFINADNQHLVSPEVCTKWHLHFKLN